MNKKDEAAGAGTPSAAQDTTSELHPATADCEAQAGPVDVAAANDREIKEAAERIKRIDEYKARTPPEIRAAFNTLAPLIRDLPTTDYLLLDTHSLAAWCLLRERDPSIFLIYRAGVRQKCGRHIVDLLDIAVNKAARNARIGSEIVALEIGELLTREFPPMETLLAPWLRRQYLVMVHAMRGVGKTHFGLGVAYAVASGGKFLKWKAEKPRRVLYIDGEMPGTAIKERLAAIVQSGEEATEPPQGYFRIITPDTQNGPLPDLGTAEGQAAYAPPIGDAELIVVDNLSSLVRFGVENEGESWLPVANWALALRREGRAVIFVHHSGKNGLQRGSSRREDMLDVVISLRHSGDYLPERGAQFTVRFEKSRGLYGDAVREFEAALTQTDTDAQAWTWRESDTATLDRVIELHCLGMTVTDVANELGFNKSTVSRTLKKARELGLIPPKDGSNGTA